MSEEKFEDLTFRRPKMSDHLAIVSSIPEWWSMPNSNTLPLLLPRLFLQHFADTSTVVEDADGELAGFLIGLRSQSQPTTSYIHFVGVRPDQRKAGLARNLYEKFFTEMKSAGCDRVEAITSVYNVRSHNFHQAMGFTLGGDEEIEGVMAWRDYDGPDQHRVTFTRAL